jgi:hypothetical protein
MCWGKRVLLIVQQTIDLCLVGLLDREVTAEHTSLAHEFVIISLYFTLMFTFPTLFYTYRTPDALKNQLYQNYTFIDVNSRTCQNIMTILPSSGSDVLCYFLQLHNHSSLCHTAPALQHVTPTSYDGQPIKMYVGMTVLLVCRTDTRRLT